MYNQLIQAVELDNIYIQSSNSQRFTPAAVQSNFLNANVKMTQRLEFYKDDFFATSATFEVNAVEDKNPDNHIFSIQFTFIIEYKLINFPERYYNTPLIKEALDIFVENNVPLNVWPYGREFIAQMTTRMGLPQLLIGTYKYIPQNDEIGE